MIEMCCNYFKILSYIYFKILTALQPVVKIEDIIDEIPLSALIAFDGNKRSRTDSEEIPLSALIAFDKNEEIPLSALIGFDGNKRSRNDSEEIPLSALVAFDEDEEIPLSALVAFNSNKLSGNDSENSLTSLMEIKTEGIPINIDYICNVQYATILDINSVEFLQYHPNFSLLAKL